MTCFYKAMTGIIEAFNGLKDFRICLATGSYYYDAIKEELKEKGIQVADNVDIMEYIHDMAKYLLQKQLSAARRQS